MPSTPSLSGQPVRQLTLPILTRTFGSLLAGGPSFRALCERVGGGPWLRRSKRPPLASRPKDERALQQAAPKSLPPILAKRTRMGHRSVGAVWRKTNHRVGHPPDISVNLECNDVFSEVVRDYRAMIHAVLSRAYVNLGCGIRENLLHLPLSPL
jgi:hypothetical protein